MQAPEVTSFFDTRGLAGLRASAAAGDPDAANEVGVQFEAFFIGEMLKSARKVDFSDGFMSSNAGKTYLEMFDQQVAMEMARSGRFGFADLITQSIASVPSAGVWRPESAEGFAQAIWPDISKAAGMLGVDPEFILAQAFHETGWGQSMIELPDQRPTFNFFGIKATDSWTGLRALRNTLEYVDGIAKKTVEPFRAYPSIGDALADYAKVLSQPRYSGLRDAGSDAITFVKGLVDGGYATDPSYGEKLLGLISGDRFKNMLTNLQGLSGMPTL